MLKKLEFLPLFLLLIFSSCNNLFENPSEKNHNTSERKYITVTGSLKLDGAFPAEFIQMYQRHAELVSSDTSRTAFPSIPSFSTTDFTVEAINTSDSNDKYTGSVSSELNSYTYTIGIPIADSEKKYKIKITAKNSFGICMTGETPDPVNSPVTVSLTNPVTQNHSITLKASQNSESIGRMELPVTIASDSGIHSARVRYENGVTHCYNVSGTSCIFSIGSVNEQGALTMGIQGGTYPLTFEFFSGNLTSDDPPECSGNLLYSFTESVNIFANMNTNTWVQNGNEPWFTTTGTGSSKVTTCGITKTMVDGYSLTEIWVNKNAANDNGSGSFFNPKKTLDGALAMLHDAGKDYTIYIMGEINGTCTIPNTLKKTGSGGSYTYARSLTLRGYTGLSEGVPQDSINGGYTENDNGHTLKILTEVPVIIKNLKITGGYSASNVTGGGGIFSTGDLTLDSGALITGNYSKSCGGGVYNDGGILRIKNGAVISDNHEVAAVDNCGGGGVFNNNGTLIMSGGTIKANTGAHDGGGIYNTITNSDKLCVAYIYGDAIIGGDTAADGNKALGTSSSGGGIYNKGGLVYFGYSGYVDTENPENPNYYQPDTSKLVAWTGKISHNSAGGAGGGFYTSPSSTVTGHKGSGIIYMNSGKISANTADSAGGILSNNGSRFTLNGGFIGGETAEEGNSATTTGGGVVVMGRFTINGGTISYNTANAGGGVFAGAGLIMTGGVIKNNSATNQGGAIWNQYHLILRGSAYIPAGADGKNDVYMYLSDTCDITLSSSLTPPEECTDGIIAKITPSTYEDGKTVLALDTEATTTIAAEFEKFGVTQPNGTQDWGITTAGKLREGVALPSSYSAMVSGNTYLVSDSSAISKIAEFSSSGCDFSDVKLKLESNVTISTTWTPIGDATPFSGTFDGNGKTVTFASGAAAEAFFGTVNGNVKNLKVDGSASVAGIAKTANSSSVIENCESSATITSSDAQEYCAGIVAVVESDATIKGCVNTGRITSNVNLPADNYTYGAGGITGCVKSTAIIDSCVNTGIVTGPTAGGIAAEMDWKGVIRNASNSGNVTSTGVYAGGIVGAAIGNGGEIENACHIYNCFNSGDVTAAGTLYPGYAGGITGKLGWGNGAWAHNCLNIGSVSLSESAKPGSVRAALFGEEDSYSRIDFCYYKEGCAGDSFGIGGSTSDTANECIKATQSGTNDAAISVGVFISVGEPIETFSYPANWTVCDPLNRWVDSNNSDNLYLEWETDTNHWPKLKTE